MSASKSLSDRFAAVTDQKVQEDFMKMSYSELSELRIAFGESKVNQKYIDVVQQDPKYVKWFTQRYQDSQKQAHKSFLFFIQMYVERMELSQGKENIQTMPGSPRRPAPHAKSKSAPRPTEIHSEAGSWSDGDESLGRSWNVENEVTQQGYRLNAMESTLSQIAQQMQMLTQMIAAKGNQEN